MTFHERPAAAEAEVRSLDVMVVSLTDHLRGDGEEIYADTVEEEHNQERITAEKIRPNPDRPLAPHEIPVREVPVRRRWR